MFAVDLVPPVSLCEATLGLETAGLIICGFFGTASNNNCVIIKYKHAISIQMLIVKQAHLIYKYAEWKHSLLIRLLQVHSVVPLLFQLIVCDVPLGNDSRTRLLNAVHNVS